MKCVFCGEREATEKIVDPNLSDENDKVEYWDVCVGCKKYIGEAQELALLELMKISSQKHCPEASTSHLDKKINAIKEGWKE